MRYWFASFYGNSLHDSKKSYGRVFKVRESNKELIEKFEKIASRGYSYRWPDGWWIGVEFVKIDDDKTYKKIKKNLAGDLGYGWIIDNILDHGAPEDLDEKFMKKVVEGNEYYLQAGEVC